MKQRTFLVVDDHGPMRTIIGGQLRGMGYTNVVEAEDGVQAMTRLNKGGIGGGIGFIVSDLYMPNMSGLEFLKQVRATPIIKQLPFLMVTAENEKEHIVAAVQAGADGYIVKPFTQAVLAEKLNDILKKRSMV